jgi:hypothetical protein
LVFFGFVVEEAAAALMSSQRYRICGVGKARARKEGLVCEDPELRSLGVPRAEAVAVVVRVAK